MLLVLASASPRRRDLLSAVGVIVSAVRPADILEKCGLSERPIPFATRLAAEKARAVPLHPTEVILAADTVVHLDDRVYGKPTDDADARRTLAALAGREHSVTTGWCVRGPGVDPRGSSPARGGPPPAETLGAVTSRVRFRPLSPAEIHAYVATGEGRDKAGGYGIQGLGAALVAEVQGDHSNVVGLPLGAVLAALAPWGITPELP
jgi:septum formation protein